MRVRNKDVSQYFYLEGRMNKTKRNILAAREKFYDRSFFPSIGEINGKLKPTGFKVEEEVVEFVTAYENAQRRIAIMEYKLKHFNRFWQSLDVPTRVYYVKRFKEREGVENEELDDTIKREIAEIEEAFSYHFKLVDVKVTKPEWEKVKPLTETEIFIKNMNLYFAQQEESDEDVYTPEEIEALKEYGL